MGVVTGVADITDFRFPRQARLLAAPDFKRVFANPVRFADSYFTVLALSGRRGPARLGLAISKKQARRAVDRNRLKRLTRENFRYHQAELAGTDLVVMARAAAVMADNSHLNASLSSLIGRVVSKSNRQTGD